jgi:hypothetical protein
MAGAQILEFTWQYRQPAPNLVLLMLLLLLCSPVDLLPSLSLTVLTFIGTIL